MSDSQVIISHMETKKTLKRLSKWSQKNNVMELALELGYKTPEAINKWIKRESIPPYMIDRVNDFLNNREVK